MTEQTAQEQLDAGFEALRQMEQNQALKKKEIEEKRAEVHRKIGNLRKSLEVSELTGDNANYKKQKKALDELKQEERELGERLALFSEQNEKLPQKLRPHEGIHRDHAKAVDGAALSLLNDLSQRIEEQQEHLRELARQYQEEVQKLDALAHRASDLSETANYARRYLPKAERVPVSEHTFRAPRVRPDWSIGASITQPANHVTD